jgi:hypothetical protein
MFFRNILACVSFPCISHFVWPYWPTYVTTPGPVAGEGGNGHKSDSEMAQIVPTRPLSRYEFLGAIPSFRSEFLHKTGLQNWNLLLNYSGMDIICKGGQQ